MMSFAVWLPVPMFLLEDPCPWSHVPPGWGGLCPWYHVPSRWSLSRGSHCGQRPPWTETLPPAATKAGVIHPTGMHTFSKIDYRKLVHVGVMEKAETDKWLLRASALERIFFVIWLCTFLVSLVLAIIA